MTEDAEKQGLPVPGSVIIEPTSGNTELGWPAVLKTQAEPLWSCSPDTGDRYLSAPMFRTEEEPTPRRRSSPL